jgi:hypothetical protein
MVTLGEPLEDVTAPETLMYLLRASAGHVEWLRHAVANVDELGEREAEVLTRLYDSERDRLTRIGEACIRAGVAEAQVRVAEAQAAQMMVAIKAVLDELRLTSGQRAAVGPALRKHAALLAGETPDAEQDARIADALALDGPPEEWAV